MAIIKDQSVLRQVFFFNFCNLFTLKQFVRCFVSVVLTLCLVVSQSSFAQARNSQKSKTSVQSPRKQITTIIFTGLAGAVLGLSTLSFYGRPQERLSNIAVGGAVGLIIGAGYSTFQAARQLKPAYARRSGVSFDGLESFDSVSQVAVRTDLQPFKLKYEWAF